MRKGIRENVLNNTREICLCLAFVIYAFFMHFQESFDLIVTMAGIVHVCSLKIKRPSKYQGWKEKDKQLKRFIFSLIEIHNTHANEKRSIARRLIWAICILYRHNFMFKTRQQFQRENMTRDWKKQRYNKLHRKIVWIKNTWALFCWLHSRLALPCAILAISSLSLLFVVRGCSVLHSMWLKHFICRP